jgi:hypothetical protein
MPNNTADGENEKDPGGSAPVALNHPSLSEAKKELLSANQHFAVDKTALATIREFATAEANLYRSA